MLQDNRQVDGGSQQVGGEERGRTRSHPGSAFHPFSRSGGTSLTPEHKRLTGGEAAEQTEHAEAKGQASEGRRASGQHLTRAVR